MDASDHERDTDMNNDKEWFAENQGISVSGASDSIKFHTTTGMDSSSLAPSRNLQRQLDDEKWEVNCLKLAGFASVVNKPIIEEEDSEKRIYITVNPFKPNFLSEYDSKKFRQVKKDLRYNSEGEIYQLAKAGSQSVVEWKKKREKDLVTGNIKSERLERAEKGQHSITIDTGGKSQYLQHLGESTKVNKSRLPILECREQILKLVSENSVVVIVGETGSGKTTQLTQFLYEDGYSKFGQIACTQPRRVAAVSVAKRVSDEMGVELGDLVGYTIRFEDISSDKTMIRYMTDGVLIRESLLENDLEKYSVVIMDEAHERSLNTDVLFGILKGILSRRHDLRVIVTSATMDSKKFSNYFGGAPVYFIKGRYYKVEPFFMRTNPSDYVQAAVSQVCSIHIKEPPGDILVFMTGQDDIECTCDLIKEKLKQIECMNELEVLPIYSQLPTDLQARVFEQLPVRKCVIATNIAETSLTIDGIRYVVDTGFCKQKSYNSKAGLDTLLVTPISQAAAIQRMGRAGRTCEGKCWRLYSELTYMNEMVPNTVPEIQRTNLANTILLLKSMGFNDVLSFDFMDKPPADNFLHALYQLWSLRAIDNDGNLTEIGKEMVLFPLDPTLSKMLLVGNRFKCFEEALTVVSMLSVPPVFYKPKGKEEEAEAMREKFIIPESDHLTLLNVFNLWYDIGKLRLTPSERDHERAIWSKRHFLHNISLIKALEIRKQLMDIAVSSGFSITSSGRDWGIVRKSICSAYFHQTAKLKGLSEYVNLHSGIQCLLHPSSSLSGLNYVPEYIVYNELVLTTKYYIHGVTAVDPLWLSQMAPEFFTATDAYGNIIEEGKGTFDESKISKIQIDHRGDSRPATEDKANKQFPRFVAPLHEEKEIIVLPPEATQTKRNRIKLK